MSTRTSSGSTRTTVPATMSPSLNSNTVRSTAAAKSSALRSSGNVADVLGSRDRRPITPGSGAVGRSPPRARGRRRPARKEPHRRTPAAATVRRSLRRSGASTATGASISAMSDAPSASRGVDGHRDGLDLGDRPTSLRRQAVSAASVGTSRHLGLGRRGWRVRRGRLLRHPPLGDEVGLVVCGHAGRFNSLMSWFAFERAPERRRRHPDGTGSGTYTQQSQRVPGELTPCSRPGSCRWPMSTRSGTRRVMMFSMMELVSEAISSSSSSGTSSTSSSWIWSSMLGRALALVQGGVEDDHGLLDDVGRRTLDRRVERHPLPHLPVPEVASWPARGGSGVARAAWSCSRWLGHRRRSRP